jgi:hypothetical protein
MNKKGIIILALGHHYYGELAANLSASIRQSNKDIPIALFYYADALVTLSEKKLSLFSSITLLKDKYVKKGEKLSYLKPKTYLDILSPFEETIYIDADVLWFGHIHNIEEQFNKLADVDFSMANVGFMDLATMELPKDYVMWANLNEVKQAYNLAHGKYYSYNSEFIYFKKTEKVKNYFKEVRKIYEKPLIKVVNFGNDLPDEFAFSIASITTETYPHLDNWRVLYWRRLNGIKKLEDITNNYFGYSFGGNSLDEWTRTHYSILATANARIVGIPDIHIAQSKRRFAEGREKF